MKELFKLSDSMDQRIVILYYLMPLLILMTALRIFSVELINILYVFCSYFWVLTFLTPYTNEQVDKSKYRFSTLRFLFVFNDSVLNQTTKFITGKWSFLNRGMPPIFLVTILWAVLYSGQFIFAFLGYGFFELVHFVFIKKLKWNPFRDQIFYTS